MPENELEKVIWRMPVNGSTQIDAIGENIDRPNTLYVKFVRGGTYAYDGTTPFEYDGLIRAKSPGSFLAKNVKNIFPFRKLA